MEHGSIDQQLDTQKLITIGNVFGYECLRFVWICVNDEEFPPITTDLQCDSDRLKASTILGKKN